MTDNVIKPTHWFLCTAIGLLTSMAVLVGYNAYLCYGLLGGMLWTLVWGLIVAVAQPGYFAVFLLSTGGIAWAVRMLSPFDAIRNHIYWIAIALLAAGLGAGNLYAHSIQAEPMCSFGSWGR